MAFPTSSMTFRDLLLETARKIGNAYYGESGDEEVQVPVDVRDLAETKRHVNNAIRMMLHDAPREGWRFLRPTIQFTIWGNIAVDATKLISSVGHDPGSDKTTLSASSDSFYESMEGKALVLTGVGTFTVTNYLSATSIKVSGDATGAGAAGVTWSMASDGNFALPTFFGGQYNGRATYISNTNQGVSLDWVDEVTIRQWRENVSDETGDPYWVAVRVMNTKIDGRRRWELLTYPKADEVMVIEFPADLHFDTLVDLDEYPPIPAVHDETIRAACLAIVEKDVEGSPGPDWDQYRNALSNSYRINSRAAPMKLGYFGNPSPVGGSSAIQFFRNKLYQRPSVTFTP